MHAVTEGTFRFSRVCSFLYNIVSRASTVDEGGADQTRFLDRIPAWTSIDSPRHLSRQFWAESGSSGDILARERGEMSLEPRISNR